MLPVSLDDLVCAALLRASRRGELDCIVTHDAPLDVLAQQITAETSCRACAENDLYALVRRAWPYRSARSDFDAVISMVADGFATPRGRRSALVHRDEVNGCCVAGAVLDCCRSHQGERSRKLPITVSCWNRKIRSLAR